MSTITTCASLLQKEPILPSDRWQVVIAEKDVLILRKSPTSVICLFITELRANPMLIKLFLLQDAKLHAPVVMKHEHYIQLYPDHW